MTFDLLIEENTQYRIYRWKQGAITPVQVNLHDKTILVAYFPESKEAVYQFNNAARDNGYAMLKMDSKKRYC